MRAAVIHTPGAAAKAGDHPAPTAGPGQSLVEVTAAAITPLDLLCASGTSYFGVPATPYVPGVAGVGVIRTSETLEPGTRVWFATSAGSAPGDGSMAEHCVVPDADLVALPDSSVGAVDDAVVAALGLSAVAAWNVLTLSARQAPGETVLVLGAGGVVGQVAIQAARLLGAGRVVAAARSEADLDRARRLGADATVTLSGPPDRDQEPGLDGHRLEQLVADLGTACAGSADVVVDPLCGLPSTAAARVLGPHGRLVNLGSAAGPTASWDSATLRSRSASILGYTNNDLTSAQRRDALLAVVRHAAEGSLSVAHERVPLEEAARGWERQATGTASGRVVLIV